MSELDATKTEAMTTLEGLSDDFWRLFPHTFAQVASGDLWIPYPHLVDISMQLARALHRGRARIVVSLPPRHGKSELISKWFPAWYLDQNPAGRVLLASYEADFASSWGRHVRNWFESAGDHGLTTVGIKDDSSAADRWETTYGGGMRTAGIGGAFTGKGGDLLIIDDPIKNWVEAMSAGHRTKVRDWFLSTFYTRAEPNAAIVVLMTRWHEQDLAGYLLKEHEDDWIEIKLPALAPGDVALCPERFTSQDLLAIRKALGSIMFEALYQQNPTPPDGGIFKRPWFRYWTETGPLETRLPKAFDEMIQSWDLPFDRTPGSSFASGQVWARKGADRYLLDEFHERFNFPEAEVALHRMSETWPATRTKVIENKAMGAPLIAKLKREIPGMVAWEPKGSKEARAIAVSGEVEAGNVWLPHPAVHNWSREFVEECATFPKSDYKDRVDAMVQALLRFSKDRKLLGKVNFESLTRVSPLGGM